MADRSDWRFAEAIVKGSSHDQSGTECQDFGGARLLSDVIEPILLLFVSDGAGTATCSRAGAEFVCNHFTDHFAEFFNCGGRVDEISKSSCTKWVVDARQALREVALSEEASIRDYACTFLGAILSETASRFIQIGDGAIVCSEVIDEYAWIFWPEKAEYANVTYFLTQDDSENHLQFSDAGKGLLEVALFSDGLERLALQMAKKTVHDPFFRYLFTELRAESAGLSESRSKALAEFLNSEQVRSRTDDDKTLVIATRLEPLDKALDTTE